MKAIYIVLSFFFSILLMTFSVSAEINDAEDTSRAVLGARPIGLGGAYTAVSNDILGIFNNPAGLAGVSDLQFTSMSGKFLGEYNYLNAGVAAPTDYGNFGFGYVGSGISITLPQGDVELPDGRIVPSSGEAVTYDQNNQVFLFSWGSDLALPIKKLSFGTTLKIFSFRLAGPGISNGNAMGSEVDLGFKYRPAGFFSAGLLLIDALPTNLGGKITWANGTVEKFPAIAKIGTSFNIIGKRGIKKVGKHEVSINLDDEFYVTKQNLPNLFHAGIEWSPNELIDIRGGLDQTLSGENNLTVATGNLTAGIGINFNNYRFDYAFHQYSVASNDTHYFSISYGVGKEPFSDDMQPFYIENSRTYYDEEVNLVGSINNNKIKRVKIGEIEKEVDKNGAFFYKVPLKFGRNVFAIKGYDGRNRVVAEQNVNIVRLRSFMDVPPDHWARKDIEDLATLGIMDGFYDDTFRPENKMKRDDLLIDFVRVKDLSTQEVVDFPFIDVSKDALIAPFLGAGYKAGLVKGYPDNTFRPLNPATRTEAVVFAARSNMLSLSQADERPYADITARHWAINEINSAKQKKMLTFANIDFFPQKEVSRAELVSIVAKLDFVQEEIKQMYAEN